MLTLQCKVSLDDIMLSASQIHSHIKFIETHFENKMKVRIIIEVFMILRHHILKLLMRPNYVNEEKMSRFYSASLIQNFIPHFSRRIQLKFFFILMTFSLNLMKPQVTSKNNEKRKAFDN